MKYITRPLILFFLIANLYFAFSNIPLFILNSKAPSWSIFPIYHHTENVNDYNLYLSVITMGQNGYILNRDAFTSENTSPGIFYIYYILVGKLSSFFHLWPPVAYHLARIISVEIFILGIYAVSLVFSGRKGVFLSSVLSVILTITPIATFISPGAFSAFTPWWYQLESLQRLDGLPHHIFGQAIFLFALSFFFLYLRKRRKKLLILSALSAFIAGIVLPPSLLPVIISIPLSYLVFTLVNRLREKKLYFNKYQLFGASLLVSISAISLTISFLQTKMGHPWNMWNAWEISRWNVNETGFDMTLIFSFCLLAVISILITAANLKKVIWENLFLFLWSLSPVYLLPFANLLGIGKIRLIDAAPFVPFAILISNFIQTIGKKSRRIMLVLLILSISLPVTFSFLRMEIDQKKQAPIFSNVFVSKSVWNTIDFLKTDAKKDDVILSNEWAGNIIPGYVPVKSYFGHINQTLDFFRKQGNAFAFLAGKMKDDEALKFMKENNIKYVYYGPEEKVAGQTSLKYPFLKVVYKSDFDSIYKFISTLHLHPGGEIDLTPRNFKHNILSSPSVSTTICTD